MSFLHHKCTCIEIFGTSRSVLSTVKRRSGHLAYVPICRKLVTMTMLLESSLVLLSKLVFQTLLSGSSFLALALCPDLNRLSVFVCNLNRYHRPAVSFGTLGI